jgi:hypothetical protein
MRGRIVTRLNGRSIVYRDELGLQHQCRGYVRNRHARLFWTLCHLDAPAEAVGPQQPGERVSCPQCRDVLARPARRILATAGFRPRRAVGGLPFKPDLP